MEGRHSSSYLLTIAVVTLLHYQFYGVSGIFVTEWPVSVSTFENNTAQFFCEVHEKEDLTQLVWFTDMMLNDNQITVTYATDNVPLNHENNGGNHSIEYELTSEGIHRMVYRITNVQIADEGLYACGFVPDPLPPTVSRENVLGDVATLEVLRPPVNSHPQCYVTGDDLVPFTNSSGIGVPLDLLCEIQGGRPVPDLTWYRNDDSVASGSESSLLNHVLSAEDNGVEFTCVASGNAISTNTSCSITPLQIPPTASITSSVSYVSTLTNITISCVGDGLPFISEIEWFINGKLVEDLDDIDYEIYDENNDTKSSSELNIFNAKFKRTDNEIQCLARTPSGLQTTASVNIEKRNNNNLSSVIMMYLLPITAATSGLLIIILLIAIGICFCKRGKVDDGFEEDIYDQGNNEAQANPYHEGISNDAMYDSGYAYTDMQMSTPDYVINRIPGGPTDRGGTARSDHPYADINI